MQITLREDKGIELTYGEGDNNTVYLDKKYTLSTSSPTVTDDSTLKFTANESTWLNLVTGVLYLCEDTTIDNAIWSVVELGGGDKLMTEVKVAEKLGIPALSANTQQLFNHTESGGISDGCALTDNGDGTIDIAGGEAYIRGSDNSHSTLYVAEVPATVDLPITDLELNIVYLDYNGGVPIFTSTLDTSIINMTTKLPAFYIYRDGVNLFIRDIRFQNIDNTAKHQRFMFDVNPFIRNYGGELSDGGTLHIEVSASAFYFQLTQMTTLAYSTIGSEVFTRYYSDGASDFTKQVDQTTVDNQNFDNGTGTLEPLGVAKFGVEWIYLVVGSLQNELVSIYGTASYNTIAEAENAKTPTNLPTIVSSFGVLIGNIIVQKDETEIVEIQSAFDKTFTPSLAEYHNNLAGLNAGDFKHLTQTQFDTVTYKLTTFNVADKLVQLDGDGKLPTLDGSALTNVPQDKSFIFDDNTLDFTTGVNLKLIATAGIMDTPITTGKIGQTGFIVIEDVENITSWDSAFNFVTAPTGLTGIYTFMYFIQKENAITMWNMGGGTDVLPLATGVIGNFADNVLASGYASCVAISGSVAYVTGRYNGDVVHSIDISDPYNMVLLDTISGLDGVQAIAIEGSVAYVCVTNTDSVASINISNPNDLQILDSVSDIAMDVCSEIYVKNSIVYVASNTGASLATVDATDPSDLIYLSSVDVGGRCYGVVVDKTEDVAYVSVSNAVKSIDVANPSSMSVLHTLSINGSGKGLAIKGDVLYTTGSENFTSIDISTPSLMVELDNISSANWQGEGALVLSGDVAFRVSDTSDTLASWDISDPDNLALIELKSVCSDARALDLYITPYAGFAITAQDNSASNLFSYEIEVV